MEAGIRLFLEGLGERFEGDDLAATPRRVARAWADDLASGYEVDPLGELGWTPIDRGRGPVVVRGLSVASICVHHLLPFSGVAHVAYLPDRRQAGLSKIGRIVDAHSRRLQTQERLTAAIVDTLTEGLQPVGVLVQIEAEHTCMSLRGVRKEHSTFVTVAASGIWERDPTTRAEALGLFGSGSALGPSR